MNELVGSYPWIKFLPTILLLLLVVGYRLYALYQTYKVRCPNCKAFNSYTVEYEGTGYTFTRTAVGREGIAREVEYKRFKLAYTCTACRHEWKATEDYKADTSRH